MAQSHCLHCGRLIPGNSTYCNQTCLDADRRQSMFRAYMDGSVMMQRYYWGLMFAAEDWQARCRLEGYNFHGNVSRRDQWRYARIAREYGAELLFLEGAAMLDGSPAAAAVRCYVRAPEPEGFFEALQRVHGVRFEGAAR